MQPIRGSRGAATTNDLLRLLRKESSQFLVFVGLTLSVYALFVALYFYGNPPLLLRLFGGVNSLLGIFLISVLGFLLFAFLLSRGRFAIFKKGNPRGYLYASGLASIFGLIAIAVDFSTRIYAADINVPFPKSVVFYPAIGYVAEIVFQLLPLALVLMILTAVSKRTNSDRTIWISILVASLIEPLFQTSSALGQLPSWFAALEFLRIYVIIISQLALFKRYDFVTMYWFRIVYYTYWHIVWGYLRLVLLF